MCSCIYLNSTASENRASSCPELLLQLLSSQALLSPIRWGLWAKGSSAFQDAAGLLPGHELRHSKGGRRLLVPQAGHCSVVFTAWKVLGVGPGLGRRGKARPAQL